MFFILNEPDRSPMHYTYKTRVQQSVFKTYFYLQIMTSVKAVADIDTWSFLSVNEMCCIY